MDEDNSVVYCAKCNTRMKRDLNGWVCKCGNKLEYAEEEVKSMSDEVVESKKGQIGNEFDMIDHAIERLNGCLSKLESELSPILRPKEPGKELEETKIDELVATADRCRNIRFSVENRSERINSILERLEL